MKEKKSQLRFLNPEDTKDFEIQVTQGSEGLYRALVTHRASAAASTSNLYPTREEAVEDAFLRLEQMFSSGLSGA